ncbi:MAG: nucleotidyltransferase domain-containing protein [Clostridiales bacterium]|nr:nucleotidyltransferase domain-containing protein [Clostridiales bacterium]
MRVLDSLHSINIPGNYKEYLAQYMANISEIPYIHTVYLFGSCANEAVTKFSDIDLFITTDREITEDEEAEITAFRRPAYSLKAIPMDIIVQPDRKFNEFADIAGMVQHQIARKGININGLLFKRG